MIDVDTHKPRLKRLIRKAAIDSLAAISLIEKTNIPVKVKNGQGELPCDLLRLLRVVGSSADSGDLLNSWHRDGRTREVMEPTHLHTYRSYDHNSHYIKPTWVREGVIYIDYYAVPMVEIVDKGKTYMDVGIHPDALDYCAYEAARIIMRDMAARGQVDFAIYQVFDEEAANKLHVAVGSINKISIDQVEEMAFLQRNAQFFNQR